MKTWSHVASRLARELAAEDLHQPPPSLRGHPACWSLAADGVTLEECPCHLHPLPLGPPTRASPHTLAPLGPPCPPPLRVPSPWALGSPLTLYLAPTPPPTPALGARRKDGSTLLVIVAYGTNAAGEPWWSLVDAPNHGDDWSGRSSARLILERCDAVLDSSRVVSYSKGRKRGLS